MQPGLGKSLLTDAEILEVVTEIQEEMAAGHQISFEDMAARLGVTLETLMVAGAEVASEMHGEPMAIVRVQ